MRLGLVLVFRSYLNTKRNRKISFREKESLFEKIYKDLSNCGIPWEIERKRSLGF